MWEIILADGLVHDYESNLIRRLAGLLYISDIDSGNIKKKVLENLKYKKKEYNLKVTYVVDENCINCKHMDCVEVCPVDCFYEGENTLVIHPDECIDCGVCEPECPVKMQYTLIRKMIWKNGQK